MDEIEILSQSDDMMIEVEMQLEGHAGFATKYGISSGEQLAYDMEGVCLRKRQSFTCRIYFNALHSVCESMLSLGYNVTFGDPEGPRGAWQPEFKYRIDCNALFWRMVQSGFKLGYWTKKAGFSLAERRQQHVQAVATRNFDAINQEMERLEGQATEHERYALSNRKGGFREFAREHASKASTLRQKLARLKTQQEQIVASV